MMKRLFTTVLVLAFTVLNAQAALEVKREVQTDRGYVSVNSNVDDDFAPDTVRVNFYVETSNKDLAVASDENKKIATKVLEALKKEINSQKGEAIKTLGFNANPEYSYKNNVKAFEKYNVVNSFEVKLKDMDKLGHIINIALNAGATRVDGLRFTLDATDAACNKLITNAVADAKGKSLNVAKALGLKLGDVKAMSVNCNADGGYYPQPYRVMNMADSTMAKGAMEAIPTEAGTIKVRVNVDAQFYLVQ